MVSHILTVAQSIIWELLLKQWPYSTEICFFAHALSIGVLMKGSLESKFWFHSLVLYYFAAFGGGILVPMILGKPPVFLANDMVAFVGFVCWFLTQNCPGDVVNKLFTLGTAKIVLVVMHAIFLGNAVCDAVNAADAHFAPSKYYPTAVVAPLVCGALAVSAAQFFPLDKGLATISGGMPWNIQGGLSCAMFYHFTINDGGAVGQFLRTYLVGPALTPAMARWMVVAFYIGISITHITYGNTFNPFAPVHKILYTVTGIPKDPNEKKAPKKTGKKVDQQQKPKKLPSAQEVLSGVTYDLWGCLAMVALLLSYAYMSHPKEILAAGARLQSGQYLATCTHVTAVRDCEPHSLSMGTDGRLRLFRGMSPMEKSKTLLFESAAPKTESNGYYAEVDSSTGMLAVKSAITDRTVWTPAGQKKQDAATAAAAYLAVRNGTFTVESSNTTLWSVSY